MTKNSLGPAISKSWKKISRVFTARSYLLSFLVVPIATLYFLSACGLKKENAILFKKNSVAAKQSASNSTTKMLGQGINPFRASDEELDNPKQYISSIFARNNALMRLDDIQKSMGWEGSKLAEVPITLYDVRGKPRLYEFRVIRNNADIGRIGVEARKTTQLKMVVYVDAVPVNYDAKYYAAMDQLQMPNLEGYRLIYVGDLKRNEPVLQMVDKNGQSSSLVEKTLTGSRVYEKLPVQAAYSIEKLEDKQNQGFVAMFEEQTQALLKTLSEKNLLSVPEVKNYYANNWEQDKAKIVAKLKELDGISEEIWAAFDGEMDRLEAMSEQEVLALNRRPSHLTSDLSRSDLSRSVFFDQKEPDEDIHWLTGYPHDPSSNEFKNSFWGQHDQSPIKKFRILNSDRTFADKDFPDYAGAWWCGPSVAYVVLRYFGYLKPVDATYQPYIENNMQYLVRPSYNDASFRDFVTDLGKTNIRNYPNLNFPFEVPADQIYTANFDPQASNYHNNRYAYSTDNVENVNYAIHYRDIARALKVEDKGVFKGATYPNNFTNGLEKLAGDGIVVDSGSLLIDTANFIAIHEAIKNNQPVILSTGFNLGQEMHYLIVVATGVHNGFVEKYVPVVKTVEILVTKYRQVVRDVYGWVDNVFSNWFGSITKAIWKKIGTEIIWEVYKVVETYVETVIEVVLSPLRANFVRTYDGALEGTAKDRGWDELDTFDRGYAYRIIVRPR